MKLPMLGTAEKTANSQFQVSLVDMSDKSQQPKDYPRTNRFFDNILDRNNFVKLFESSILKSGGRLIENPLTHPLFTSFYILDDRGHKNHEITIYH